MTTLMAIDRVLSCFTTFCARREGRGIRIERRRRFLRLRSLWRLGCPGRFRWLGQFRFLRPEEREQRALRRVVGRLELGRSSRRYALLRLPPTCRRFLPPPGERCRAPLPTRRCAQPGNQACCAARRSQALAAYRVADWDRAAGVRRRAARAWAAAALATAGGSRISTGGAAGIGTTGGACRCGAGGIERRGRFERPWRFRRRSKARRTGVGLAHLFEMHQHVAHAALRASRLLSLES